MARIFISYSRVDQPFTRELAQRLRRAYDHVWFDDNLYGGQQWWAEILKQIAECDIFLYLLSRDSVESSYCQSEFQEALRLRKQIIPVLIRARTQIPPVLSQLHYVDMSRGLTTDSINDLQAAIIRHTARIASTPTTPTTPAPTVEPYVPPSERSQKSRIKLNEPSAIIIGAVITGILGIGGVLLANSFNTNGGQQLSTLTPTTEVTQAPTMTETPPDTDAPMPTLMPTEMPLATSTSVPLGFPGNPVTRNDDWTSIIREFSGVQMALVPVGCFDMGENGEGGPQCFEAPFWIDVYEVTNAQYGSEGYFSGADRPREEMTWYEADTYCRSRGGKLPTEAEWEYAATGPDGWLYPWGDGFAADAVIYVGNSEGQTANVGSRPQGIAWTGAFDMSGNVSEWVSTTVDDGEGERDITSERVTRGGSWGGGEGDVTTIARGSELPHTESYYEGFRCARDFAPSDLEGADAVVASQIALQAVTRNDDWTPVIQDFDGVQMALVPVGCFMMGNENGDDDEKPVHQQCFDEPFWVDVYEVTNTQYGSEGYFSGNNRPRELVTWFAARNFCLNRGKRLPTEAEWEYSARGPDGLRFPWGNEFEPENVVFYINSNDETADVGSKLGGVSWVGALDMSGNVWEWTSTVYRAYPYSPLPNRESSTDTDNSRVLRGGSWNYLSGYFVTASERLRFLPSGQNYNIGFRCARDFASSDLEATG